MKFPNWKYASLYSGLGWWIIAFTIVGTFSIRSYLKLINTSNCSSKE